MRHSFSSVNYIKVYIDDINLKQRYLARHKKNPNSLEKITLAREDINDDITLKN